MTSIARQTIFLISLKLIILMTIKTLKLVYSKQKNGLIIPMYIVNIFMDLSMYIMNFFSEIILITLIL
jgi:hypothetical protein